MTVLSGFSIFEVISGRMQSGVTLKHPFKLLVVDIDGTLLDKDGNISSENEKALARVRETGIRFSLCTGRSMLSSKSVINHLALDGFHIFFDGALVSSPDASREVYVRPIKKSVVREIVEYAHEHDLNLEIFSVSKFFTERESWTTEIRRQFFGIEPVITDLSTLWDKERVIKANLLTTNAQEVAKAEAFGRHFKDALNFSHATTPAYPGVDFVNLLAPGVTKGKALEALTSYLGVTLAEVIAIGDGSNDIPLLATAGLAIAMGNASPEVKAVADHVTEDIDHGGLAKAIERFLL